MAKNPDYCSAFNNEEGADMRRRVRLFSASVLVFLSLSMTRGTQPTRQLQQPQPHHPAHGPSLIHPEMAASTTTRATDWGVLKTTLYSSPHLPAPVIDGSKTPQQIPDDVALRTLLGTMALPEAPSRKELARINPKFDRLELESQDLEILKQEMRLYHKVSTELKQRIDNIRQTSRGTLNPTMWSALRQEDQALSNRA